MSRDRFECITRCFHIKNKKNVVTDCTSVGYNKVGKLRWLIDEIREKCKALWKLENFITIDEMMVGYSGKHCVIRQYLHAKSTKWGIKVWCLTDATSKYVWIFYVYYGANKRIPRLKSKKGEACMGESVVLRL